MPACIVVRFIRHNPNHEPVDQAQAIAYKSSILTVKGRAVGRRLLTGAAGEDIS